VATSSSLEGHAVRVEGPDVVVEGLGRVQHVAARVDASGNARQSVKQIHDCFECYINYIIEKFNYHDILSFHKIIIAKIRTVDPIIKNLSHPDGLLVYLDFSKKLFWNIRYFFFELQHYHVNALAPRGGLTLSRSVS
jgi:hypothetical protein